MLKNQTESKKAEIIEIDYPVVKCKICNMEFYREEEDIELIEHLVHKHKLSELSLGEQAFFWTLKKEYHSNEIQDLTEEIQQIENSRLKKLQRLNKQKLLFDESRRVLESLQS